MRLALLLTASLVLTAAALAGNPPDPVETHVVATGSAPCGTAVGKGAVWVGVYGTGKLLRLDPASGRVTGRIPVGSWACRVALAGKAAWVTRDRAGMLVHVDLNTGRRQSIEVGASPFDVILAAGAIWVTSFDVGTVARIDPATRRLTRVYRDGPSEAGRGRQFVRGRARCVLARPRGRRHVDHELRRRGHPPLRTLRPQLPVIP